MCSYAASFVKLALAFTCPLLKALCRILPVGFHRHVLLHINISLVFNFIVRNCVFSWLINWDSHCSVYFNTSELLETILWFAPRLKMATTSDSLPLVHILSPELRNIIYELAMAESSSVDTFAPKQPDLTEACRTIRSESPALFYPCNAFCGTISGNTSTGLKRV